MRSPLECLFTYMFMGAYISLFCIFKLKLMLGAKIKVPANYLLCKYGIICYYISPWLWSYSGQAWFGEAHPTPHWCCGDPSGVCHQQSKCSNCWNFLLVWGSDYKQYCSHHTVKVVFKQMPSGVITNSDSWFKCTWKGSYLFLLILQSFSFGFWFVHTHLFLVSQ